MGVLSEEYTLISDNNNPGTSQGAGSTAARSASGDRVVLNASRSPTDGSVCTMFSLGARAVNGVSQTRVEARRPVRSASPQLATHALSLNEPPQ